jgi:hypothetical protein
VAQTYESGGPCPGVEFCRQASSKTKSLQADYLGASALLGENEGPRVRYGASVTLSRNEPSKRRRAANERIWHFAVPLIETSVELILSDGVQPKELRAVSTNMEQRKSQRNAAPQCIEQSSHDSAPRFW